MTKKLDFGRFKGDRRHVVILEETGYQVRKGRAQWLITNAVKERMVYSNSGMTADVIICWCNDTNKKYKIIGHYENGNISEFKHFVAAFKSGVQYVEVKLLP